MSIATPLRTQIEAIKARIDALAATATAEDIVMLSKAVEAIGGQASVFDVMAVAEEKAAEIEAAADQATTSGTAAIDTAKTNALASVETAKNQALNTLAHSGGVSLAQIQAAALSL